MEVSTFESLRAKNPIDAWSTREHLCLTSAVCQCGDQNWGAVSRAVRQLNVDSPRPNDWFSTKNCALQYTKLLEGVETPKRKREKNEEVQIESPGVILHKTLVKQRTDELKSVLEQKKSSYLKLLREVESLESSHGDSNLHELWNDIIREQEEKDREMEKEKIFYQEREERLKKFLAMKLSLKGSTFPSLKRKSPIKPQTPQSPKSTPRIQDVQAEIVAVTPQVKEEVSSPALLLSPIHSETSDATTVHEKDEETNESIEPSLPVKIKEEEDEDLQNFNGFFNTPERMAESEDVVKVEPLPDNSSTVDVSSVSAEMGEATESNPETTSEHGFTTQAQTDHDYSHSEETPIEVEEESLGLEETESKAESVVGLDPVESPIPTTVTTDSEDEKPVSPSRAAGSSPVRVDSPLLREEKKPPKKEPRDEYEFDDDASRESTDVREYLSRGDRRKLSMGEGVRSPAMSEGTPSSPASTNYGDDPEAEKQHRAWKRSVMLLFNDIAAHKNASIFLKPISEERVPGYRSIVKRPIDLISLKRSIESGAIRSTSEFQRDLMLMFLNAKMYNKRTHNIYRMTEHMMKDAVETIEEFIRTQSTAKAVETPVKQLRRETRESSAKRGGDDGKRKRDEAREEKSKRRKN